MIVRCSLGATLIVALTIPVRADDWPMFRADAQRSAFTPQELPERLQLAWTYRPDHAPAPAWPRLARMTFDRAHQVAVAEGTLVFGSSVDGRIVALDAQSGAPRWSAYTEGPVRFAPAIHGGRVFVGSDDGFLHAFDLNSGDLVWKRRGGPDGRRVLGNERMISRWPVRGGPVVRDGVVYFVAGIWPSDGIFVHALDARTGEALWLDDESGSIQMAQPHGGAEAESGVSAQGHLVATEELLLVPTGRAVPAAFARDGSGFRYYHLQQNSPRGGTATMASGKFFFNSGVFFDAKSGALQGSAGGAQAAIAGLPDGIVSASSEELTVYRWHTLPDSPGQRALQAELRVPEVAADRALIVCGRKAVVGGVGRLWVVDLGTGAVDWSQDGLGGTVLGLAAADGLLFASLDDGSILAFGASGTARESLTVEARALRPPTGDGFARAARSILEASGKRAGYCVDLDAGAGELALELARGSELFVVALEDDPRKVSVARARLTAAGLYGQRVVVQRAGAADLGDYPPYFADLVVSSASLQGEPVELAGARRLQRPEGGVLCFGPPDDLEVERRGPVEGSGSWTHQYADPANTVCSGDALHGPLGMLWFREVDQVITQRHGRGPAPLVREGRIFSLGLDSLVALDAYNGRVHWEVPLTGILAGYQGDHLMGTAGTHGLACVTEQGLYVRQGDHCLRFDQETGELLGRLSAPATGEGTAGRWGYIASEGGRLFGTLADPQHVVTFRYLDSGDLASQLTESRTFFALDATSGEVLWRYDAEHSIRHNAIAIGDGRVLLIDRPQADFDRTREANGEQQPGVLRALDAASGELLWEVTEGVYGTLLALSVPHQALLMAYQPTRFRLASEIGGRMRAFDVRDGRELWERAARYDSRPLINDRTVYAQGGAWDLRTGEPQAFPFSRSYGCGVLAAGENLMVFRSATLGYCEFDRPDAVESFGGLRPGCWINAIPAGGLVLVPDGSAGCVCSYQNKSWVALHGEDLRPPVVTPAGGSFSVPVEVRLAGEADARVRYTLDGSRPDAHSALSTGTLRIEESSTLRVASFREGAHPSRPERFDFTIDPHLLPLADEHWRTWDRAAPVNEAPSAWSHARGVVRQRSNIHSPQHETSDVSGLPHYGTLRIYEDGQDLSDGTLRLELRSADDDGIGVAFRLLDETHHYLLHLDRQRGFRALARRDGDDYEVLALDREAYAAGTWMSVEVRLEGPSIRVRIDGREVFQVTDERFPRGTLALHSWGSTGAEFRAVAFEAGAR